LTETPTIQPWIRHPAYKYGMLAVIALLGIFHLWTLFLGGPGTVDGARIGLVVIGILLLNHMSASFLTQHQQRRFAPLQIAVVVAGSAYVLLNVWSEFG